MTAPADGPLARLHRACLRLEDGLLVVGVLVLVGLAAWQILARNLWGGGLSWAEPVLRALVLWLGLLGAMVATRSGGHIRIDVLGRLLPPRWARLNARLVDTVSAAVCALLAYQGGRLVIMDWQDATPAFGAVPAWVVESAIPLGFTVMALRFALQALTGPAAEGDAAA